MSETDYLDCLWFGGCNGVDLLLWIYFSWLRVILPFLIACYVPATAWAIMSLLPDYSTTWPRRRIEEEEILRRIAKAGDRWPL